VPLTSATSLTQKIVIGPVSPEILFLILTDPDITPAFFIRCSFRCESLEPGAPYSLVAGEQVMADGVIVAYQPTQSIELTFAQRWDDEIKDPPGRVRLSVTERSPLCEFTVVHDGLNDDLDDAWLLIASGLKTLVETDRGLPLSADEAAAQTSLHVLAGAP
jgi:uncharacterized protein YndB with AHSA1/START domain